MATIEINSNCESRLTPIEYAIQNRHPDAVKLLWEHPAIDPDPLAYAAEHGHLNTVKFLVQIKPRAMKHKGICGRTPLANAAQNGHIFIVKFLLKYVTKHVPHDEKDRTPLSLAAETGHVGIVQNLLHRQDVCPTSKDKNGYTPLDYAEGRGHRVIIKLLRPYYEAPN